MVIGCMNLLHYACILCLKLLLLIIYMVEGMKHGQHILCINYVRTSIIFLTPLATPSCLKDSTAY